MRKGEGNKSNWFRLVLGCGSRSVCPDLIGKPCRLREKSGKVGSRVGGEIAQSESQKNKNEKKKENEKKTAGRDNLKTSVSIKEHLRYILVYC
jgi:hypothetical protein